MYIACSGFKEATSVISHPVKINNPSKLWPSLYVYIRFSLSLSGTIAIH